MDSLTLIKRPIEHEFSVFVERFNQAMTHEDGLLGTVLAHIRQRGGKRMRPILTLLLAKNFGEVTDVTQYAAVALELLHTASLVHDDVPKAMDETIEMLEDLENEPVITVPDIPQESDLLNDKNKIDIDKVMREGF